MIQKVKIFSNKDQHQLQADMNDFISDYHRSNVKNISITIDPTTGIKYATVLYEEEIDYDEFSKWLENEDKKDEEFMKEYHS